MRITLLAAGFVIGKSCQLCAVSSGNAKLSAVLICLQHKSASTMCCLRLGPLHVKLDSDISFCMNGHGHTSSLQGHLVLQ